MKKLALLLLVSLLCGLAFAAELGLASYKSAFNIHSQNSSGMDISFTMPEFTIFEETVNGQIFHRINMPDAGTLMQSGMPELPVITTSIAIPYNGSVNIEVLNSQQSLLTQFNAYPLQQGQELEMPKSFVRNNDYYSGGGNYPTAAVQYSDPQILRDFRIINIQINPFSFNANTQELTVYSDIQLRVNFTSTPGLNELNAPVTSISSSFDKMYQSIIQNYSDFRPILLANTPPRFLIIHGNTTDATFLSALDSYVLWKRQKGADVDVATTAATSAGSSTSSIQTYIRNRYNNPETRPDQVILIGDTTGSYAVPYYTNNGGGSDYPFTFMNAGDMLGDVFIGRISVENISQFLVLLNKIYLYEKDMDVPSADWLNRMLLVGDNQPSGISTMYISKYIKEMALEENPDYTFTELYSGDPSPSSMNAAINQGIGFFSYRGYIGMSGWAPSESAQFNGNKLPHAIIITCSTGNYWAGAATTEAFIRLGSTAAPKGSVTAVGMSTSSTHTTFNNVLHGGIFEGIFTYGMRTMGEAVLHGKMYMNQIFGVSSPANVEKFTHWCNLMGDPTMEIYTGIPGLFTMSTDSYIPLGLSLLDVAITDGDNLPVEGASVVLSLGNTILARGYTDAEGNVILVLPSSMTAGNAVLTVSRHNYMVLQSAIEIMDVATLVPAAISIDDDNTGASSGNDNDIVTAGETIEIFFGLKNTGAVALTGVNGVVTSDSPWITITQGNISYPSIEGTATANNLSPIVFEVAPDTPHQTMLRLNLEVTDSANMSYVVSEFIPVEAAKGIFISSAVVDGQNQVLDPGETVALNLNIKNIGAASLQNVYGRLYTENDLISIVDHTAFFGEVPVNTEVACFDDNFTVWLRPQTLPGMVMPLTLKLYNAAGFEQMIPFTLTVGVVASTDPLGPDNYGYVIYDWTDVDYPEAAVYDWIEIAPPAGGFGTPLSISDSYNSGDEGDQVGAQSVDVVSLPFPFQFYGRLYDQITVSSNGFLAMGVTENGEFRNFRLPGAMGPSPMIAPFWDDLATHSGSGIYTYFDRNNHSFIIEWYNLRNGKNGTSPETFQVILYDQATYNTSLGDGPIKFQYHTFNNVDSQSGANHGNYSTIGIEDHTGTRGLEYTFNNTYPTAAAALSNGKALYITNVPTYHEEAHLQIGETYISDNNNVVEPGETVSLGIQIQNSGNLGASDIVANLTTDDPFITIVNGTSNYFPMEAGASGVNRNPFIFEVAADCPSNRVVNFGLNITAGETSWDRQFTIRVDATLLQYDSYMIVDYDSNYDGVIDANEQVKLIINLKNASEVEARNVAATLSSTVPNLTIGNPTITVETIAANQIMQIAYDLDFEGVTGSGTYLPFQFEAVPQSGSPITVNLDIPYGLPNVVHEFELNNGGFISETGWAWGTPVQIPAFSGSKVWGTNLSGQYPNLIQYHLVTPKYTLSEGSTLNFKHYYGIEQTYDGANFAISTNAGQSWTILTPTGGYNGSNISGLAGEAGWTGTSGNWVTATFDLAAYSNTEVMFRFRFGSDGANASTGWFIDNFQLNGVNLKTGFLKGVVYPSSGADPSHATVMSHLRYATAPASDGQFKLYLPNGTHSATATMKHHQSSTLNNIVINPGHPIVNTEFTLIDLPAVQSLDVTVDNDTGAMEITWLVPNDPVLPISSYRVYRRFNSGPYEVVQENGSNSYSETLTLQAAYRYYVAPMYMNVEGSPSEVLYVPFPYVSNADENSPGLVNALGKNYPNPFNPTTTISFSLATPAAASLTIFNSKGQVVRRLISRDFTAGNHQVVWDGRDDSGRSVSSGIYFYRMQSKVFNQSRKMILMK